VQAAIISTRWRGGRGQSGEAKVVAGNETEEECRSAKTGRMTMMPYIGAARGCDCGWLQCQVDTMGYLGLAVRHVRDHLLVTLSGENT